MLSPQSVADFLEQNPGFFEQHTDLLARLQLPHPHGGRTVSIAERQLLALRDRVRVLEEQVAQLVGFGRDNDALGDKVHALACALLARPGDVEAIVGSAASLLREQFNVPSVAARVWLDGTPREGPGFEAVTPAIRDAISALPGPRCAAAPDPAPLEWLGAEGSLAQSFAVVPLVGAKAVVGVLLLASDDPHRFESDHGTQHLARIGALLGHALAAAGDRGA